MTQTHITKWSLFFKVITQHKHINTAQKKKRIKFLDLGNLNNTNLVKKVSQFLTINIITQITHKKLSIFRWLTIIHFTPVIKTLFTTNKTPNFLIIPAEILLISFFFFLLGPIWGLSHKWDNP